MQEFDDLCLCIRHAAEFAEAAIQSISQRIQNLVRVGYLTDSVVLGNHIWHRPASDLAESDDFGIVYQPALWTLCGYGLIAWDASEFLQLSETFRLQTEARVYFKKFEACSIFEKSMIFADYNLLLEALLQLHSLQPLDR